MRTALITGGPKGLAKSTARHLANLDYNLVMTYRNQEEALELQKKLQQLKLFPLDLTKEQDLETLVANLNKQEIQVDILINMGGPFNFRKESLTDMPKKEWQDILTANLITPIYLSQLLIPQMRQRKWGRIINIGYAHVQEIPAWIGHSVYAIAKTGLVSLTKTLSQEELNHGITVNMINPGDIRAPYKEIVTKEQTQTGGDIARVIEFLIEADHITGAIIDVTSGYRIS